jgi:hypothetical protein
MAHISLSGKLGLGELAAAERDDLGRARRWISLFDDEAETVAARVGGHDTASRTAARPPCSDRMQLDELLSTRTRRWATSTSWRSAAPGAATRWPRTAGTTETWRRRAAAALRGRGR